MTEQSQIKDIQEVKDFLLAAVKGGLDSNKDGVWNSADVQYFTPALILLPAAMENIGDVGAELKILPEHIDEFASDIASKLGLDDTSKVKTYIDAAVKILENAYLILKTAKVVA